MRALLNVYYCLDDTTLSCVCGEEKKQRKDTKRGRAKVSLNMMTAFFLFLMYTYMRTLFHFYHGSRCWALRNAHLRGDGFQERRIGRRFFLGFARCCCPVMTGVKGALGKHFLYLAFLKQPAIR